jgi:L-threonate 2-dehydrogenase
MADAPSAVGIIGLGNMGGALALRLLAGGYEVLGCDPVADRRAAVEAAGGRTVATPAEVLDDADLVVLSLPSPEALDQVVTGRGGLLERPRPNAVVAETSTFSLEDKERARRLLAEAGMTLLDCPIGGTGAQARQGDIVFYASGPEDSVHRFEPVLRTAGRDAPRVGDFGAGTTVKFVHNLLVAVHTAAAAEALNLARAVGIDLEATLGLLQSGASASRMLDIRGPMIVADDYPGDSATMHTLSKDVELIRRFADQADVATPMLSIVSSLFAAARGQGLADADPAAIARVFRSGASAGENAHEPPKDAS